MRVITQEEVTGRALTEDEKGWLRQRDRHAEVEQNEELFDGEEDDEAEEAEGDNYASWKNKELVEEGARRTPPVDFSAYDANKAGYVAALRAWDLEHPE